MLGEEVWWCNLQVFAIFLCWCLCLCINCSFLNSEPLLWAPSDLANFYPRLRFLPVLVFPNVIWRFLECLPAFWKFLDWFCFLFSLFLLTLAHDMHLNRSFTDSSLTIYILWKLSHSFLPPHHCLTLSVFFFFLFLIWGSVSFSSCKNMGLILILNCICTLMLMMLLD